jgi:hypothetical protein
MRVSVVIQVGNQPKQFSVDAEVAQYIADITQQNTMLNKVVTKMETDAKSAASAKVPLPPKGK